jgi:hypothetical protein
VHVLQAFIEFFLMTNKAIPILALPKRSAGPAPGVMWGTACRPLVANWHRPYIPDLDTAARLGRANGQALKPSREGKSPRSEITDRGCPLGMSGAFVYAPFKALRKNACKTKQEIMVWHCKVRMRIV